MPHVLHPTLDALQPALSLDEIVKHADRLIKTVTPQAVRQVLKSHHLPTTRLAIKRACAGFMRDSTTMLTHVRVHSVINMLMGLLSENIGVRETKEARGMIDSV